MNVLRERITCLDTVLMPMRCCFSPVVLQAPSSILLCLPRQAAEIWTMSPRHLFKSLPDADWAELHVFPK